MVREKIKNILGKGLLLFRTIGIRGEKEYFIENLALLLSSGMGISGVLESLRSELRSARMRAIIDALLGDIEEGFSMWQALERTALLPAHVISLLRIGEETGRLAENLKIVVIEQQKERIFRSKIRSAMMYPVLVLSLTVIIGAGIAWFILPRLATVFSQLKLQLPFITRALISSGNFLQLYGTFVIPTFLFVLAALIYFLCFFPRTKFIGQIFLFHTPGVKRLIQEVELSRFGYILGTLLKAGLPVVDAIGSLRDATTFYLYKKLYLHLQEHVRDGNSFGRSFDLYKESKKLIPLPMQHMIAASEKSGHLSETLLKIGEIYENKTDITTKDLAVILEPILLVIVWLGVVGVALAVILPIYSLIGGITK